MNWFMELSYDWKFIVGLLIVIACMFVVIVISAFIQDCMESALEDHDERKKRLAADAAMYEDDTPDYAYDSIREYESITGLKVNAAFKTGWDMARTTNRHTGITVGRADDQDEVS